MSEQPITVLFIGGYGRSGSTLLERLYGELEGFFAVGEIRHIWRNGFKENQLTSEGVPFRESPLWGRFVQQAFGDFDKVDVDAVLALKRRIDRIGRVPDLLAGRFDHGPGREELQHFMEPLVRLYSAVREETGAQVIVDSSKHPVYAWLLSLCARFDLRFVHMVRDSRAVGWSWQRKRKRPEIYWKEQDMPLISPFTIAWQWMVGNWLLERLACRLDHHLRVRYEDLVTDPAGLVATSLDALGVDACDLSFINGHQARLGPSASVAGNPFRFKQGEIVIRADEEWREAMGHGQRALVAAMTAPYLRRYGYR